MPTSGKHRSTTKRSSSSGGSSYASAITTVVFVCIFILGIWMLTSNSYVSPNKSTTRLGLSQDSSSRAQAQGRARKVPIDPPAFEDNPGDLPEDAIQPDDGSGPHVDPSTGSNETTTENIARKEGGKQAQVEKAEETEESTLPLDPRGNMSANEDHRRKNEHQKKKNDKQMNMTRGDEDVVNNEDDRVIEEEREKRDKKEKQTYATGHDDNMNTVNNEEQEKGQKTDMQTHATGGNDKWNMVNSEEHEITEEEEEKKMEKLHHHQHHEEQSDSEETSKNQIQQKEVKTVNKTQPPVEEFNTETTTAQPNKDSKAAKGDKMMIDGSSSGIPKESNVSKKKWKTQAGQSDEEKERRQGKSDVVADNQWELCNVTSGTDYVPCLDNQIAIKNLASRNHFEHRERHCPEESPMCLVPIPEGYKTPIPWPQSRDKIWFHNVPHKALANIKGHQNWVKVTGEFLTFPGGGTQFIHGALHYIDMLQQAVPEIEWGKHTRVILDVGCGVASFGGYLFDRNVLAMSFAPNDEHESQIQFALERGIPAISAVMGTRRLPFPSNVFDLIHCARCRVSWHREGSHVNTLKVGCFFWRLIVCFAQGDILFGQQHHDWCESFSTYPRTYDLLHADHLFSMLKKRCKIVSVIVEVDRIVRPGGKLIVRDESSTIGEIEKLLKSLHWDVRLTFSKNQDGTILSAQKSTWRPDTYAAVS